MGKFSFAFFFVAASFVISEGGHHKVQEHAQHFSNEVIVRVEGSLKTVKKIATQSGFRLLRPVHGFNNTYRLIKLNHPTYNKRSEPQLTEILLKHDGVVWAEQLIKKRRQKRDFITPILSHKRRNIFHKLPNEKYFSKTNKKKSFRDDLMDDYLADNNLLNNDLTCDDHSHPEKKTFNDELWGQQWYLHDNRTNVKSNKLDLNVLPCYDIGITGKGIRINILDDGIEHTHDDLKENYDPEISFDVVDNDCDPTPNYKKENQEHGTRCAGTVAMKANNGKCGVGVAFNAKIGGIRLLDDRVDDEMEGSALGHAYGRVDIYSSSWGPNDFGKTVDGPKRLALEAIERGIKEGRNGKGAIFVWAAGNGGYYDDCNCDGYANSIYTLTVGSVSQQGRSPNYAENCAPALATTCSSGSFPDEKIVTTDLHDTCTTSFTGTSASAPLAAGVIALVLEANPDLTWRDVQHLVVHTSKYAPLRHNEGWKQNGAGYWVHSKFGFGLMNAFAMVSAAANWTTVPEYISCSVHGQQEDVELSHGEGIELEIDASSCTTINNLEHVQLQISIDYPVRGKLEIHLTSPSGTKILLLSRRERDRSDYGFEDWKFMSVLTWNENPQGIWKVSVQGSSGLTGKIKQFILHAHGTEEIPEYLKNGPRQYNLDSETKLNHLDSNRI